MDIKVRPNLSSFIWFLGYLCPISCSNQFAGMATAILAILSVTPMNIFKGRLTKQISFIQINKPKMTYSYAFTKDQRERKRDQMLQRETRERKTNWKLQYGKKINGQWSMVKHRLTRHNRQTQRELSKRELVRARESQ